MKKIFTIPTYGSIDFDLLSKKLKLSEYNDWSDALKLHTALRLILDSVFSYYGENVKFTERKKDNCCIWQMKRYECFLVVYLKDASISYTVRLNTLNSNKQISCLYFSSKHMEYIPESLCLRTMRDFSRLVYECKILNYAFEHNGDAVPRQTYLSSKSWFCSEHEDIILSPLHYYEGYIDYKKRRDSPVTDNIIPNKWDEWLNELIDLK